jgi:hypothetical protein
VSQADLLARIVRLLDAARIPFMITGSTASSAHGAERATRDIDLVIDPDPAALRRLVASLSPKDYYVSEEAAREALLLRRQFSVIDVASGLKVDLIVRKNRPWSLEEFRRRMRTRLLGVDVFIATAEDVILSKLEWAKAGGSERQLEDVVGILGVKGPTLERPYVERWARELGVVDLWERANRMAANGEEGTG